MSRPFLPRKASAVVDRITPATWNSIVDCLAYAMSHPRGDGVAILNDNSSGMLRLNTRGVGMGSAPDAYKGPFALEYDAEKKVIRVSGGFMNRNGEFVQVPPTESLVPQSGYICACSEIISGEWTPPAVRFAFPSLTAYPIGKCSMEGQAVELCAFRVPVAVLMVAAECPLSAEADKEGRA